ncbi:MAG TPA: LptE family protein [Gemmatimonadales bacterium]
MHPRSGSFARSAVAALLVMQATGCLYSFKAGGGLPPTIKSVAVIPFDNKTGEPLLTTEVSDAITQAVQGRLGLRIRGEADADAVVTGEIVRYDPDVPLAYSSTGGVVDVTRRQVTIVVNVEIMDQKEGKALWRGSGLSVSGEYQPPAESDGRRVAIQKLVTSFVEGVQSQW